MNKVNKSIVRAVALLNKRNKKFLITISILQVMLGLLDLIGVALIGILGALSINGIQSRNAGGKITSILNSLHLENMIFQRQVAIIGFAAMSILMFRTILSAYFIRRTYFYLGIKSAEITGEASSRLFERDLLEISKYSVPEILYYLTVGINSITIGIIGTIITAISDASILLLILTGLLLADFSMGITVLIIFSFSGGAIYILQQQRARKLGIELSSLSVVSEEKLTEAVHAFREIKIHNRQQFYASKVAEIRVSLAKVQAELNFMPQISKYVIESTLLFGTLLVAGIQFYLKDAVHAVGSLAIFLAAGSRVAPAVLRLQQSLVLVRTSIGTSTTTLDLLEDLYKDKKTMNPEKIPDFIYDGFSGRIEINNLSFSYGKVDKFQIKGINLVIEPGTHVAIVGPSGSGKTTLADILLGMLIPNSGEVLISGLKPKDAIEKWPGAISYVPQFTAIFKSTIEENIALGFRSEDISDERIKGVLEKTELTTFVNRMSDRLPLDIGERGGGISGGQRQRIGIARALYSNPKLLILDEATSALDGNTEFLITERLKEFRRDATMITIAHRLSTVRNADLVIYIEEGQIKASGSFQAVRDQIPNFDQQANLMGLVSRDGE